MAEPMITGLPSKFGHTDWFPQVRRYWKSRFLPIQARFMDTFRYVEMSGLNRSTFSYEYASILRDCGSVFGSALDEFVRRSKGEAGFPQYTFADYRRFLIEQEPTIPQQTVEVRSLFPHGVIIPFDNMKKKSGVPKWWIGYNKVKHSEMLGFSQGNLENCVHALGALALLGRALDAPVDESLFTYVGDLCHGKGDKSLLFMTMENRQVLGWLW